MTIRSFSIAICDQNIMSENYKTEVLPPNKPENHVYKANVGNTELTIETGRLAQLAGGAVTWSKICPLTVSIRRAEIS